MYNEELKNRFINECVDKGGSTYRALRIFGAAEPFEREWGDDLCTIPEDHLGEALDAMLSARLGTQSVDLAVLRKYARWCMDNQVPGACDGLLKKQETDNQKLREFMVGGPKQLQDHFDHAFPPENYCRQDNLCRCYFWMAFMGLDEDEAAQVKTEHVDLKNSVVKFNNREYPIYREAAPVFRHLCTANSFIYDYVRYETVVERLPGTEVLRGMKDSNGVNTDAIRRLALRRIKAAFETTDTKVSLKYKSVQLSGTFYRMHEEEMATGALDIQKFLDLHYKNISAVSKVRRLRKELEFSTDYQRWKAAFDK